MPQPLDDTALDQVFRTARTYNGYLNQPVSEAQLHAIWDLMKMGRLPPTRCPRGWCGARAPRPRKN